MAGQRRWQRIILLVVLGYEGLGALLGGSLLVAEPNGRYMDMPVEVMHGTFKDFLVPGLILFNLGVLNVAAFFIVLRRHRLDWVASGVALGGLAVWFFVEIVILRELHWLHVMWGFPVILGIAAALPLLPLRPVSMRDVALVGGVVSSLLYAAMNVFVALQWPAYDSASQTVSELSAVGAPTRPLWVVLGIPWAMLVTAFGWGARKAAGDDRRLQLAGSLIAVYGALCLLWPFAPMHQRAALASGGGDLRDTLHLALAAVTVVLYLLAMGFAASALGKAFRAYSVASFAALLTAAALTFRDAPRVGENLPTPLIGVWERVNIGVFLLWVVVLAAALLARDRSRSGRAPEERPRLQELRPRSASI